MKIHIHGNCQAPALADILSQACGPAVSVTNRQVFNLNLDQKREVEAYCQEISGADVIITQPVADGYRGTEILSTRWIREHAKPTAQVLLIPVVYHRGQLPQCFTLSDYHDGRLAYHDAHAIDAFLTGAGVEKFLWETSRSDFLPEVFVQSELARTSIELLRREREANVDVAASASIAHRLLTEQPMYAVNHPSRSILLEMSQHLLGLMGRSEQVTPEGLDMLSSFVMPPYLSTMLGLGSAAAGIDLDNVRVNDRTETRQRYFEGVFDSYDRIGRANLAAVVSRHPDVGAYLGRYRQAKAGAQVIDERAFVETLYRLFLDRFPDSGEVAAHLMALRNLGVQETLAGFANSDEFAARGRRIVPFADVQSVSSSSATKDGLWKRVTRAITLT